MSKTNVLVMMTDQHCADLMTCAGRDSVSTPNPDQLTHIRVAAGTPVDEDGFHSFSTELGGYNTAEQACFRQWLQADRHLNLADLGQRW